MMKLIDDQYMKTPVYGTRSMRDFLNRQGYNINRKRVQRLMRLMGLEVIYPKPKTSKSHPGHRIYPYLLKGLSINRPDMVWASDITYIPLRRGFMYLVAVIGLAQQESAFLAHIQHTGFRLLCIGLGGGNRTLRQSRDIQHRPGQSVHKYSVYRHLKIPRYQNQHGWPWPVYGQHLCRTALVDGEVSLSSSACV